MSHITTIEMEENYDLDALKQMCIDNPELFEFVENQKTYKWYGHHVGDYPIPEGFTVYDMGKCDHAIRVKGAKYEIGVVRKGKDHKLLWDFWSEGGLAQKLGKNAEKLRQAYQVAKVKVTAKKHRKRYWEKPSKLQGWRRIIIQG